MNRKDVLKEMKDMIGKKDPVEFFTRFVDVFTCLFDEIDELKSDLHRVRVQSALAIKWEPRVATDMIATQIDFCRKDKDLYVNELIALKKAFAENIVTQNYEHFCHFWVETFGYHPFLSYK